MSYSEFTRFYSKLSGRTMGGFESYHLAARLLEKVKQFDLRNAQLRCVSRTVSVQLVVPHDINSAIITL